MKNLYLVTEGAVTLANENTEFDGTSSVLCLAKNSDEAHWLAARYDADLIQFDNVIYNGKTVAALSNYDE